MFKGLEVKIRWVHVIYKVLFQEIFTRWQKTRLFSETTELKIIKKMLVLAVHELTFYAPKNGVWGI